VVQVQLLPGAPVQYGDDEASVPGPDGTAGVLHTSIEQVRFLRGLPSSHAFISLSLISMAEKAADNRWTEVRFLPGGPIDDFRRRHDASPRQPRVEGDHHEQRRQTPLRTRDRSSDRTGLLIRVARERLTVGASPTVSSSSDLQLRTSSQAIDGSRLLSGRALPRVGLNP
jgi:hypothetical protein